MTIKWTIYLIVWSVRHSYWPSSDNSIDLIINSDEWGFFIIKRELLETNFPFIVNNSPESDLNKIVYTEKVLKLYLKVKDFLTVTSSVVDNVERHGGNSKVDPNSCSIL